MTWTPLPPSERVGSPRADLPGPSHPALAALAPLPAAVLAAAEERSHGRGATLAIARGEPMGH